MGIVSNGFIIIFFDLPPEVQYVFVRSPEGDEASSHRIGEIASRSLS
jgi:hypothetical protein